MKTIVDRLRECAINNTASSLWCVPVLSLMLYGVHQGAVSPGMELLLCAGIGLLFGWCLALWAAYLLAKHHDRLTATEDRVREIEEQLEQTP